MSDKDAFTDRRRSQEEEYFRKREQELIAKMRQQKAHDASRRGILEQTGLSDETLVQTLVTVGYTPETTSLLLIVPLIHVAWAEGQVADREREQIVEAARARGVDRGSAADQQLADWLTNEPPDELFDATLRAIAATLQARPAEERDATRRDLIASCEAIAGAAGGIFGLGKASSQERDVVARIRRALAD